MSLLDRQYGSGRPHRDRTTPKKEINSEEKIDGGSEQEIGAGN
jgi:hypothetical protein